MTQDELLIAQARAYIQENCHDQHDPRWELLLEAVKVTEFETHPKKQTFLFDFLRHSENGMCSLPEMFWSRYGEASCFKIYLHYCMLNSKKHPTSKQCYREFVDALRRYPPFDFNPITRIKANHAFYCRQFIRLYRGVSGFNVEVDLNRRRNI